MNPSGRKASPASLPIAHPLSLLYVSSLGIALMMAVACIASLLDPARIYPTDALWQAFLANDVVDLVIGTVGGALVNQTSIPETNLAVQVADLMIVPAWLIGGVLLWRRKALGYVERKR